jgi:UDP-N-acetylglucosamine:LPS N-acetylglucosamine transferase
LKVCIVSSCGGHLTEVRALLSAYEEYTHIYVLNDKALLPNDMQDKTFYISHSERDLRFFLNLWEAFRLLLSERPDVLLSTGAGPIVPFALVGRFIFGCRVIFVETITRIEEPSMTGKIMYKIAHEFYFQWKSLRKFFPNGIYGGPLI